MAQAVGRVLAEEVRADRDQPPFDRSTRDGFAVRAADLVAEPRSLTCVGTVAAGERFAGQLAAGECVEIMTGAPLPEGADAVVMVEHTSRSPNDAATVLFTAGIQAGDNVVPRAAEALAGAPVVPVGRRLDPATLGLLASVGKAVPLVTRRPRVAVITTGNEVVPVGGSPAPHQIRNSNEAMLTAAVQRFGGECHGLGPVSDDPSALRHMLQVALAADLVIVTGGVSKGKHDHVKAVLESLGATFHLAGVAMRPGKPFVLAEVAAGRRRVPVLGLPGNPLSALVAFGLFGRSVLARLAGMPPWAPRFFALPLAVPLAQAPVAFTSLAPARLAGQGVDLTVEPLDFQGSGDLVAMADADVLICLPPQTAAVAAGSFVRVVDKA